MFKKEPLHIPRNMNKLPGMLGVKGELVSNINKLYQQYSLTTFHVICTRYIIVRLDLSDEIKIHF